LFLTLFRCVSYELPDERNHSIRYDYSLLDGQHPLKALHELGIESLLSNQHCALRTLLRNLGTFLLDFPERHYVFPVIRSVVLDLSKDGRDESEVVDEVVGKGYRLASSPRYRPSSDWHDRKTTRSRCWALYIAISGIACKL
jgi:hypothetical protein